MKKILTVEDLVLFCSKNEFTKFSANDFGYQLCVQVPAVFEKSTEENDTMLFGNIWTYHTGLNRNGSNVTIEAAKRDMKKLAYKPLLANFTTDKDGNPDFTSHDMFINEDGEMEYLEKQIGCFTVDKPTLEEDPENKDHMFVKARVAIPREYTKAAEIIERKGGTKVSVELIVNEMEFSAKDNQLLLTDVETSGCTCLGIDPDTKEEIGEGMKNARLEIEDFSSENNSVNFEQNNDVIEMLAKLEKKIDNLANFNINENSRKEEDLTVETNKEFEEEVTETEQVEETAAEEETVVEEETSEEEVIEEETEETPAEEEETSEEEVIEEETSEEEEEEETEEEESEETETEDVKYSLTLPDGSTRNFACLSDDEIHNALSQLVNDTYSELDNDYYSITVYQEDKKVVMCGWFTGQNYRQSYKKKNNIFSLDGERIPVHSMWLSDDEEKALNSLKENYELVSDKLAAYEENELETNKMSLLSSVDYVSIHDKEEFSELINNHANFSLEELTAKCDEILAAYVKEQNRANFASSEQNQHAMKPIHIHEVSNVSSRYGGLFKKEN